MVPLNYNVKNLTERKRTTFAAGLGLALVVFVFACAQMLGAGIVKAFGRGGSEDVAIVLRKGADSEQASLINENQIQLALARGTEAGAKESITELVTIIQLEKVDGGMVSVSVRGVPENVHEFLGTSKIVEGRKPLPGSDEVLVGAAIRGRIKGLDLGKTFELKRNRPMTIVGIVADGGSSRESEIWVDLNAARTALNRVGHASSVRLRFDSRDKIDAYRKLIDEHRREGIVAKRESTFLEEQTQLTGTFLTVLGIVIAILFSFAAMLGATITMNAQVAGRQREIGTLRALGFSRSAILGSFLIEALILAVGAGIIGAAASIAMKLVRISTLNQTSYSEIVFTFEPTPAIIIRAVVLAAVMGLLGGMLPAIRAARVSPVKAMRA